MFDKWVDAIILIHWPYCRQTTQIICLVGWFETNKTLKELPYSCRELRYLQTKPPLAACASSRKL